MPNPGTTNPELRWRVPTGGDPQLLKLALARIGLASLVAALALLVAAPRPWLVPGLVGLIPVAIWMAYRRWGQYQRSLEGEENLRLDDAGLHWLDAAGREQVFCREDVLAFRVGREEDTLRPVPALTLHLAGGFESQPIELHPPATPQSVRQILVERWRLEERGRPDEGALAYDHAVAVYSECHDEYQEWHWEGTRQELKRFFALFQQAAEELPLAPVGAKPAAWVVLAQRRQPARVRIARASSAHFDAELIAAPAEVLRSIAALADQLLKGHAPVPSDEKFDVELAPKNIWTFHLHVREA